MPRKRKYNPQPQRAKQQPQPEPQQPQAEPVAVDVTAAVAAAVEQALAAREPELFSCLYCERLSDEKWCQRCRLTVMPSLAPNDLEEHQASRKMGYRWGFRLVGLVEKVPNWRDLSPDEIAQAYDQASAVSVGGWLRQTGQRQDTAGAVIRQHEFVPSGRTARPSRPMTLAEHQRARQMMEAST